MIKEIDKNNFEKEVLKEGEKVLVDFNADWCGPCKMLKPILDEIAEKNESEKIVSVNIDKDPELAKKYGVMSIPCLILFENGEEKDRHIGLLPKEEVEDFLRR